jgi:hypothetical protein
MSRWQWRNWNICFRIQQRNQSFLFALDLRVFSIVLILMIGRYVAITFSGYSTATCVVSFDSQQQNYCSGRRHKAIISLRKCFHPLAIKLNTLQVGREFRAPTSLVGPSLPALFVTHAGRQVTLLQIVLRREHRPLLLRKAAARANGEPRSVSTAAARDISVLIAQIRKKPRKC